jgi:hypothetical protein
MIPRSRSGGEFLRLPILLERGGRKTFPLQLLILFPASKCSDRCAVTSGWNLPLKCGGMGGGAPKGSDRGNQMNACKREERWDSAPKRARDASAFGPYFGRNRYAFSPAEIAPRSSRSRSQTDARPLRTCGRAQVGSPGWQGNSRRD